MTDPKTLSQSKVFDRFVCRHARPGTIRGDPLMPRHPMLVWKLPWNGHAVMVRLHPFTVSRRDGIVGETQPVEIQIDPESKRTGLPVSGFSYLPKSHALDAACVEKTPRQKGGSWPMLDFKAMGRGPHGRPSVNRFGVPVRHLMAGQSVKRSRTGDIVHATVRSEKNHGNHVGRVTVRASRRFNIRTPSGNVQGVSHRHCRIVQRGDGHGYDTLRQKETETMHGTLAPAFLRAQRDRKSCESER